LGRIERVESVGVRWPSGLTERFSNVRVDAIQDVKEGTGVVVNNASH
jgi:hypothetical protein